MGSKTQPLKDHTGAGLHELKEISQKVITIICETLNELSQTICQVTEGLHDGLLKCNNEFDLAYSTLKTDIQSTFGTIIRHTEEQTIETSELRLWLQDAYLRIKEMKQKTSTDMARLLEEERASAEAERRNFLNQIVALYDLSFQTRWDRLQRNYGTVCDDISNSVDLMEGLTTHSRVDECITKQKQFVEKLVHLRSQLEVRMEQDQKTIIRAVIWT
ncbi:hypothetical protein BJX99DRAFT_152414 [Aspergillus californicus]